MTELLRQSLIDAPIIKREEYDYFVHPVTDGIPLVEAELLREIADGIEEFVTLDGVDRIVTPESMGIPHATALTLATDIPFTVIRKRPYHFENEVQIPQQTGYSEQNLYINDVREGDHVLVLDDVCSTGGTLAAICTGLEDIGAEIVDIVVVIQRGTNLRVELPADVKSLVTVDIVNGKLVIQE